MFNTGLPAKSRTWAYHLGGDQASITSQGGGGEAIR